MADLARVDQLAQRFNGVLDGRGWINPVLVVQVDVVGAEPAQRSVHGYADVLRRAVARWLISVAVGDQPELGCQHHMVTAPGDRPPDEFLVAVGAVYLGSVDERNAEVEGAADRADGLGIIGARAGVIGRHAHRSEAEPGHFEAAEIHMLHREPPALTETGPCGVPGFQSYQPVCRLPGPARVLRWARRRLRTRI